MALTAPTSPPVALKGKEDYLAYIREKAPYKGVDPEEVIRTINCENRDWDTNLQSYHKVKGGPNGREDSWGLSQINVPSWKGITREQATDPEFALDFIIQKFSEGRKSLWTCWRLNH